MSFENTLFAYLANRPGLSALMSDRIYPDKAPQDCAAPYVYYLEVYREKNYSHSGYNATGEWSIQLSSYAATKDQVRLIADQVSLAMDAWPGANSKVGHCLQENEQGLWVEELKLYCIDQDYTIFYED